MAFPVKVEKKVIEKMLDSIGDGRPVEAPAEGWNRFHLLALAGVCRFAAMTHGPIMLDGRSEKEATPEKRELLEEQLESGLTAAISWYAQNAMWVKDGEYDTRFDETHSALVAVDEAGKFSVRPVEGFKDF